MELIHSLKENPYFGAGFGLFGLGALAAIGRNLGKSAGLLFKRHFVTVLEVPCNDKSYHWMLEWITKRGATRSQHLSVRTSYDETDSGKVRTSYTLVPSIGTHVFRHRTSGTWLKIDRCREQQQMDIIGGTPWETVTMTALGRHRNLFLDILDEAQHEALQQQEGKTITYTFVHNEWRQAGRPKAKRRLSSVILEHGISEKLVQDVVRFLKRADWYKRRGVPYRRGYLLHGPPGCGKTSFISAVAAHLDYSICILHLSDQSLTDERLAQRLADTPENSIVLLEDVDAAFVSRAERLSTTKDGDSDTAFHGLNRLTFSGLLNALDGVSSSEPRILFMTTNHLDRLDDALIRPGRVDFKQYVGFCSADQVERMLRNFFPDEDELTINDTLSALNSKLALERNPISPAKLQGFLVPYETIDELRADLVTDTERSTLS